MVAIYIYFFFFIKSVGALKNSGCGFSTARRRPNRTQFAAIFRVQNKAKLIIWKLAFVGIKYSVSGSLKNLKIFVKSLYRTLKRGKKSAVSIN